MNKYLIPCVLFAGGKSSRMGKNKALLPFSGYDSLTHYQYERLGQLFEKVYIATKQPELFEGFKADFIDESAYRDVYAPTAGFVASFKQLDADTLFVLSVDAPFVSQALIDELLEHANSGYDAVVARTAAGMHPMCGIYSRSLQKEFERMMQEDNHKLGKLLKNSRVCYVDVEDEDLLMNVNTPDEYHKALAQLGE